MSDRDSDNENDEFTAEEREQYKKENLVNNSLGSLLLGLGGNKKRDVNNKITKGDPPAKTENGSYSEAEKRKAPVSNVSAKADYGWGAAGVNLEGGSSAVQQQELGAKAKKIRLEPADQEFSQWSDTRKYNSNEVDQEWVDEENRKLDEEYGENIITAKPNGFGGLEYYCELCFATMNAYKPLEMHCSGMKHLKKKDMFLKSKASGEMPLVGRKTPQNPPKVTSSYGREDLRYPRDESYDRDRYSRDSSQGRDRYASNEYNRDPYRYGSYERDAYRYDLDYNRDIYQDKDRYGLYDRRESLREGDKRGMSRHGDEYPYAAGAHSSYSGDRSYYDGKETKSSHSGGYWGESSSSSKAPLKIPTPPPVAPSLDSLSSENSGSLAGGPAAVLLTKLSQCSVKNEMDAELASNVINLLLRSLKEYNSGLGEKSVADLMEQAEIKLGTAKAIKSVRKPAVDTTSLDAITLAMNTLRQAKEKGIATSFPRF